MSSHLPRFTPTQALHVYSCKRGVGRDMCTCTLLSGDSTEATASDWAVLGEVEVTRLERRGKVEA